MLGDVGTGKSTTKSVVAYFLVFLTNVEEI